MTHPLPILWTRPGPMGGFALTSRHVLVHSIDYLTLLDLVEGQERWFLRRGNVRASLLEDHAFVMQHLHAHCGFSIEGDLLWEKPIEDLTLNYFSMPFQAVPQVTFQGRSLVWVKQRLWEMEPEEGDLDLVESVPMASHCPRHSGTHLWSLRRRNPDGADFVWSWDGTRLRKYPKQEPNHLRQGLITLCAGHGTVMVVEWHIDKDGSRHIYQVFYDEETYAERWRRPWMDSRASQPIVGLGPDRLIVPRTPECKELVALSGTGGPPLWKMDVPRADFIHYDGDLFWIRGMGEDSPIFSGGSGLPITTERFREVRRLGDRLLARTHQMLYCLDYNALVERARRTA